MRSSCLLALASWILVGCGGETHSVSGAGGAAPAGTGGSPSRGGTAGAAGAASGGLGGHGDGGSDGGSGGAMPEPEGGLSDGGSSPTDAGSPEAGLPRDAALPREDSNVPRRDGAACHAVERAETLAPGFHVDPCSYVTWDTNPPSSGSHYPTWAAYQEYTTPIPRGFWVHDLEHGAVVITYNCPSGCDAEVALARQTIAAIPDDTTCIQTAGVRLRFVLTPDPKLDVAFAASAWGYTLKADCFDPAAFSAFISAHYDHAPEDICSSGPDVSIGLPAGCGEPP
ncbi:MAG TPA: DUF3105 domain-containing protein [Polyangiaceae bacterium]|nr:DUF3105 domain-containing protein [Polyangiaceae bacterium]